MTDSCSTCQEPYSKVPSVRASVCSNSFHCCRDCTWVDGRRTACCVDHLNASNTGWTFSATEENGWTHFGGHTSADDAASHAVVELELSPGDTFWVGYAIRINYADLADSINALTMVENLQEAAYEKWGYEEAFDEVSTEQGEELEAAFRKAFTDWVEKHKLDPGYYHIESAQKRTVPVAEGVESSAGGSNA